MKVCARCKTQKEDCEFYIYKRNSDGLSSWCKQCQHEYDNNRSKTADRIAYAKLYSETHKEQKKLYNETHKEQQKRWYEENKERKLALGKIWVENNKEHQLETCRLYAASHKKQRNAYKKKYYQEHKEQQQLSSREYRKKNKEVINQKARQKYANNVKLRLSKSISNSMYRALKLNKTERHWETLVSYNLQQLKEHLEKQFDENMNWNNYGIYWEIDHIIPVNTFDFSSPEDSDFKICWSLANLRPLEKHENQSRPKNGRDISIDIITKIRGEDTN